MDKILNRIMLLLVTTFGVLSFASCGDDRDNEPELPESTIVNGIDISLLSGYYSFSGNIAPNFTLYPDGTCKTYSTGNSTSNESGIWKYDKESRILVLLMQNSVTHTYTIKSITDESLTAEWSSVKYGNFTSTWERHELILNEIDISLLPGTYVGEYSDHYPIRFIFREDGTCDYRKGSEWPLLWTGTGTWKYDEESKTLSYKTYSRHNDLYEGSLQIQSLTETELVEGPEYVTDNVTIWSRIN